MTRIIINQQSVNNASKAAAKKWADNMMKKSKSFESTGTKIMQNAIRVLRVYDKGGLEDNSTMDQAREGNNIIWSFETKGVPYAYYPRNGLGSSSQYGPRKYDVKAAIDTLRHYNISKINLATGRARRAKPRDSRIPPLNNL